MIGRVSPTADDTNSTSRDDPRRVDHPQRKDSEQSLILTCSMCEAFSGRRFYIFNILSYLTLLLLESQAADFIVPSLCLRITQNQTDEAKWTDG